MNNAACLAVYVAAAAAALALSSSLKSLKFIRMLIGLKLENPF
jgi:hypothetical protein